VVSVIETVIFVPLAILAIIGAAGMVSSKNPVHSALFLILNFFALAGIFLVLLAPFLAVLQVIVYAGAIMVLFLFVILFFVQPGQKHMISYSLPAQTTLASILVIAILSVTLFALYQGGFFTPGPIPATEAVIPEQAYSVSAFGKSLFTSYVLPFELTSILLLIGMLGAVVLARKEQSIRQSPRKTGGGEEKQ